MPYQGETFLYSRRKNSAPVKAVAVWPDGKELAAEPSGRSSFVMDLFSDREQKREHKRNHEVGQKAQYSKYHYKRIVVEITGLE